MLRKISPAYLYIMPQHLIKTQKSINELPLVIIVQNTSLLLCSCWCTSIWHPTLENIRNQKCMSTFTYDAYWKLTPCFSFSTPQEYKRKLARVTQVRKELRSRLSNLPGTRWVSTNRCPQPAVSLDLSVPLPDKITSLLSMLNILYIPSVQPAPRQGYPSCSVDNSQPAIPYLGSSFLVTMREQAYTSSQRVSFHFPAVVFPLRST